MARILNTLLARLVLSTLAINLLLAPLLYAQIVRIAYEGETERYEADVRAYTRFIADILESQLDNLTESQVVDFLDLVVLSRDAVYAELRDPRRPIRSSLAVGYTKETFEDFSFGEHDDHIYFIQVPVQWREGAPIPLILGFDERSTELILDTVRHRVVIALVAFLTASVLLAAVLGQRIAGPLRDLQAASQKVAKDDYKAELAVSSRIREIRELANDLERMRNSLVVANDKLRQEFTERANAERRRLELERTLRHVQKLETIGTLAGGIAHEFNNILQPVRLYTELAMDELAEGSTGRGDLQRVLNAVTRAKKIVEQILVFSRKTQGESFEIVDVGAVVDEAVTLARDLLPATVTITSEITSPHPCAMGDPNQLHQLIMNLCSNAYLSLPAGGGSIMVKVSQTKACDCDIPAAEKLKQGEYVRIDVSDNGSGIDPMTLERIFEPFFTTRGPREGTGLGLSVAHGIARAHRGSVVARSKVGEGSTFSVCLPAAKGRVGDRARRADAIDGDVVYIGTAGSALGSQELIESGDVSKVRIVDTPGLLAEMLESAAAKGEAIVLDLGDGELWDHFCRKGSTDSHAYPQHLLVVAPDEVEAYACEAGWVTRCRIIGRQSLSQLRSEIAMMKKDILRASEEKST